MLSKDSNNINIIDKNICVGCTSCYNICTQNAITMKYNEEGFKYPIIDENKCTNCGLCKKRCPILYKKNNSMINKCYAAFNNNEYIRRTSSSGGIFELLAKKVLNSNGKVIGAAFNEENILSHVIIDNYDDLEKLKGSKYLQSNLENIFKHIKADLLNNKKLLFVGTPCQVAGLKTFLNKEYKNLIEFIRNKEKESLRISEFLLQFYIEKMLNLKNGKENVQFCKEIIKQGDIFSEILEDLNINKKEKHEIFIKCLKENINDYYMSSDMEDMKKSNKIIIATPYTYINANINRKIQLWLDIGSNVWNMKIEKDISNPLVLRKSFKEKIYSDEMEENYKKYYLYNLIYNLLINSEEVYAFKSDYSVNGFMQESMMYGLLLRLLDKGEKVDE